MTLVLLAGLSAGVLQDAHGNVVPNRQVNVYARGTSTPVQVYSDSAGASPVTQPLTTDSSGQVPGYVTGSVSIDLVDTLTGLREQAEPVVASAATGSVVVAPPPSGGDDAPIIQALVAAGRTVQLRNGVYTLNTTLTLDGIVNFKLVGAGGQWYTNTATVLSYTGNGTAVSLKGTGGTTDGAVVSSLAIHANTATMLLDLGTTGAATAAGSSNITVEKSYFDSSSATNTMLNLAQAISCHVVDCGFSGGGVQIQGVTTTSGFSNTHTIQSCYFTGATIMAIRNPCQNWLIEGCTFEPLAGSIAGALSHDGTVSNGVAGSMGLTYIGNSHQDSTTSAGSAWVTLRGQGLAIIGNSFLSHADVHVKTAAAVNGLTIIGNVFLNDDVTPVSFTGAPTQLAMLGNQWNSAHLLGGTTPGTPALWMTNSNQAHLGTHLVVPGSIALWGAAAQASQFSTTGVTAGFTVGAGTAMNSASTSTGNSGSTAYTFGDLVAALKTQGLLAS